MAEPEGGGEAQASPLLLDTHAAPWWFAASPSLSERGRAAIADPRAPKHVSAAGVWEIATKQRLGRLGTVAPVQRDLVASLRARPTPTVRP